MENNDKPLSSSNMEIEEGYQYDGTESDNNSNDINTFANNFSIQDHALQMPLLEAAKVYVLMPRNVPVSRATRFQWLLDHLNCVVTVPSHHKLSNTSNDLEIISVVPSGEAYDDMSQFLVTSSTEVIFLSQIYRFVYCLDMSPSQSAVDVLQGQVLFDEIINCFRTSLLGLCRQFTIPRSTLVFQPCLYLTVIVNTPFFISPAQQVIIKGVQVSSHNVQDIINLVQAQFHHLEGRIADVSAKAYDQIDQQMLENEVMVGALFDLAENECIANIPMVSPDANFVNMLRYSMLAMSLLPENSLSYILVITDGVVSMPDSNILESLLYQLHYDGIIVSFLKVGSHFKPQTSAGYVPYTDLLHFLARSTLGSVLDKFPVVKPEPTFSMNLYQELYLLWSFHSNLKNFINVNTSERDRLRPDRLYTNRIPTLLSKRQAEEKINSSLLLLVSRRMREGYTVSEINYHGSILHIKLTLHWKTYIYIHYELTSPWPVTKNVTHIEFTVSAPYDFLHDITCIMKKETKSTFRQAVFERFWIRSTQLASNDAGLAQQLSSFQNSNVWYTCPESVRGGMPVFTVNTNLPADNTFLLHPSDPSCPKFAQIWQPICYIDTNNWRKWFHTHRMSLILKHDHPLPKYMHLSNSSGRFQVIQCRQAATALYGLLSEWSSFVLVDNNTYLKLLYREHDKPPAWFCIVRISSKLPCATINMGFITGTPGYIRHRVIEELKLELSSLSYLSAPLKSRECIGCTLLLKPLEKILIRYERMPTDFHTVIFPDGTQNSFQSLPPSPLAGTLFTTLSRYLFHQRWIWSATHLYYQKLDVNSMSRILSTLTRMRLKEGFNFAHSASGIVTMVLELPMEPNSSCVVQYVLFPPHSAWWGESDGYSNYDSDDDMDMEPELDAELQIVTEVWIEPQHGIVQSTHPRIAYMDCKHYYELADVIKSMDMQCIHSLLTLEHLSLMCQDKNRSICSDVPTSKRSHRRRHNSTCRSIRNTSSPITIDAEPEYWNPTLVQRIQHVPFQFDLINILLLSQQTELLFSMFIEETPRDNVLSVDSETSNKLLLENIQKHLVHLNDHELDLSVEDSSRFIKQVIHRHKNKPPHLCPLLQNTLGLGHELKVIDKAQWRCFVKGISVTHVILTMIPATLDDLKSMVSHDSCKSMYLNAEMSERSSSQNSNYSEVPINATKNLVLPVYVYDCPLGVLVDSYVNFPDASKVVNRDVYEDHRYKYGPYVHEDSIKLKSEDSSTSPEPKSDESESNEPRNSIKQHCKAIILTHSKCFAMSLFSALHYKAYIHSSDVQAAMDQCEETLFEIDITEYLRTVCGHIKHSTVMEITMQQLNQPTQCNRLKPIHHLIKEKFLKITGNAFMPIPTNREFYYCRNLIGDKIDIKNIDSDDEISGSSCNEILDFKSDKDISFDSEAHNLDRSIKEDNDNNVLKHLSPLFLHFVCTVRYNGQVTNMPVRVLPTCLGELNIDTVEPIDKSKIHITLDILCLTLPMDVQNVINDYTAKGFRTTSFCSDGFQPSCSSASEASFSSDFKEPEPLCYIPEVQKRAINTLKDELRWLLHDEIATALLDVEPVTANTLTYIMKHVSDSSTRTSCLLEIIDLNFVYGSTQSYEKFVQEFCRISIPGYKLCKEGELYYLAKDPDSHEDVFLLPVDDSEIENEVVDQDEVNKADDLSQSDISSLNGSIVGIETGYDEDVSEDEEDYKWLIELNNKRPHLPNFWLITQIEQDAVTVYFHCRFLQLPTTHVGIYIEIQRAILDAIRDLCKCVNQSLLLQSLHDTRTCNHLLEPDDNYSDWNENNTRNMVFSRLKSMEEMNDESDLFPAHIESTLKFKPGYFSCPVVWEIHFLLHPRLKTGPGKSGLSIGISVLKTVLEKFSVTNRNNMFVYKDVTSNVFYLRLHENIQNTYIKGVPMKSNEFEQPVSRSPSIASLPVGPQKSNLARSDFSISSTASCEIRPRVRSFGEKDTKDGFNEDTVTLKVYGITKAGDDIRCELMQVLQNRLDDAVLEMLSIMLSRNAMCPLTPEDVKFLQKPFRMPEHVIKLSIQDHSLKQLDAFVHYLKQNLLQFLNVPKYTDPRPHFHFKDYMGSEQLNNKITEDNIFIYNQSQNPSTGNKGIACIALAIIVGDGASFEVPSLAKIEDFGNVVASKVITKTDVAPLVYLEFRIWKQGRVNYDVLHEKLCAATSHATWDIIMENHFLKNSLCVEHSSQLQIDSSEEVEVQDSSEEVKSIVTLDTRLEGSDEVFKRVDFKVENVSQRRRMKRHIASSSKVQRTSTSEENTVTLEPLESGDAGKLSVVYQDTIFKWMEFAMELKVPALRKITINLTHPHPLYCTVREVQSIITNLSQDVVKCFTCDVEGNDVYLPYMPSCATQEVILISRNFQHWKLCVDYNRASEPPDISSHALKHVQKFLPLILNGKFIPRQRLLCGVINRDSINLYVYNWSKDNVMKLRNHCTNLGHWLNVRASVLNSSCAQKMGLFHNQAIDRKAMFPTTNPYTNCIGDVECMIKFPRDKARKASMQESLPLESFRDNYKAVKVDNVDPVVAFTVEMHEIKKSDRKQRDELKKLYSMYQSRTSTSTQSHIQILLQNSRIIHYCHTPLLFLSRWRLQAAATRDHSIMNPLNYTTISYIETESEQWHENLYSAFVTEYKRYLQILGFMSLEVDNVYKKHMPIKKQQFSSNSKQIVYMQKAILGGILLFTIQLMEPFFITKLHAIECSRIQSTNTRASISQFTTTFLDECDRIKVFMHLHSFTYDFHLRSIFNYISNNSGHKVCEGYHLIHFLDDFMKYYNKAPNYARNLVHADSVVIRNLLTEGKQLYTYLLSNVKQYNLSVISMKDDIGLDAEYVLVQVSSISGVSYKDSQDRQHTDDFDITLIISNICESPENVLHLKYYLILTSRREIYPKTEVERKLGKFRTVSSTSKNLNLECEKQRDSEENEPLNDNGSDRKSESDRSLILPIYQSTDDESADEQKVKKPQIHHVQIKQESVNYLGYYSSHEQLMQQLILNCADNTQKTIRDMVTQGMVHCRTHLLWNKLLSQHETSQLTYSEFVELKNLARMENLCDIHPNLGSLINQPFSWYQGLAKLLLTKYHDQHRAYFSEDGNIQHYVILHPRYVGAFMMLSIDLHTSRGDLYAVYRAPQKFEDSDICISDRKMLMDGFINCICFYLWSGMI